MDVIPSSRHRKEYEYPGEYSPNSGNLVLVSGGFNVNPVLSARVRFLAMS